MESHFWKKNWNMTTKRITTWAWFDTLMVSCLSSIGFFSVGRCSHMAHRRLLHVACPSTVTLLTSSLAHHSLLTLSIVTHDLKSKGWKGGSLNSHANSRSRTTEYWIRFGNGVIRRIWEGRKGRDFRIWEGFVDLGLGGDKLSTNISSIFFKKKIKKVTYELLGSGQIGLFFFFVS